MCQAADRLHQGDIVWEPPPDARQTSRLGHYMGWLERTRGLRFTDYDSLWRWSVDELEEFWLSIWQYFEIRSDEPPGVVLTSHEMPGARWFPGTRLNYAEQALRHRELDDQVALVAYSQTRAPIKLTRGQLRDEVARVRAGLQSLGVGPGDRVAGYLANIPEAAIALLASASLGAIWSVCPPEFGVQSVLDRLAQIDPKVLFVVDGYRFGGKVVDRTSEIAEIRAGLPGLAATVLVPYLEPDPGRVPGAIAWSELRATEAPIAFERVAFDHPLWILYSSGTTGVPKAIVHGHGGIMLEHLKVGALMQDFGPGRRYFFFSTTAWMVWNRCVSTLLTGAGFAILDGSPVHPQVDALFRFIEQAEVTDWGVSASYLMLCRNAGVEPARDHDLSRVKTVVAAGSPLPLEGYEYLAEHVCPGHLFYSGSGGTDVCSAFVSGTPLSVVTAGEIPARMLGVKAEAYDEQGRSVIDQPGELVISEPMPSMPVAFWNDPDGTRLRSTYFEHYPGKWRHGDRFIVTSRGTCNIIGRSDATLNRGGVRLGTGEFYSVVEALPEVQDSLVVHLEDQAESRGELLLFVVPAAGHELDDELRARLGGVLARQRSPRHVPDRILSVPAIPKTLTGKKLEIPIKQILLGADPEAVASAGALADPGALKPFVAMARGRSLINLMMFIIILIRQAIHMVEVVGGAGRSGRTDDAGPD
jgi:acetoacetyl-CoA synthetase